MVNLRSRAKPKASAAVTAAGRHPLPGRRMVRSQSDEPEEREDEETQSNSSKRKRGDHRRDNSDVSLGSIIAASSVGEGSNRQTVTEPSCKVRKLLVEPVVRTNYNKDEREAAYALAKARRSAMVADGVLIPGSERVMNTQYKLLELEDVLQRDTKGKGRAVSDDESEAETCYVDSDYDPANDPPDDDTISVDSFKENEPPRRLAPRDSIEEFTRMKEAEASGSDRILGGRTRKPIIMAREDQMTVEVRSGTVAAIIRLMGSCGWSGMRTWKVAFRGLLSNPQSGPKPVTAMGRSIFNGFSSLNSVLGDIPRPVFPHEEGFPWLAQFASMQVHKHEIEQLYAAIVQLVGQCEGTLSPVTDEKLAPHDRLMRKLLCEDLMAFVVPMVALVLETAFTLGGRADDTDIGLDQYYVPTGRCRMTRSSLDIAARVASWLSQMEAFAAHEVGYRIEFRGDEDPDVGNDDDSELELYNEHAGLMRAGENESVIEGAQHARTAAQVKNRKLVTRRQMQPLINRTQDELCRAKIGLERKIRSATKRPDEAQETESEWWKEDWPAVQGDRGQQRVTVVVDEEEVEIVQEPGAENWNEGMDEMEKRARELTVEDEPVAQAQEAVQESQETVQQTQETVQQVQATIQPGVQQFQVPGQFQPMQPVAMQQGPQGPMVPMGMHPMQMQQMQPFQMPYQMPYPMPMAMQGQMGMQGQYMQMQQVPIQGQQVQIQGQQGQPVQSQQVQPQQQMQQIQQVRQAQQTQTQQVQPTQLTHTQTHTDAQTQQAAGPSTTVAPAATIVRRPEPTPFDSKEVAIMMTHLRRRKDVDVVQLAAQLNRDVLDVVGQVESLKNSARSSAVRRHTTIPPWARTSFR